MGNMTIDNSEELFCSDSVVDELNDDNEKTSKRSAKVDRSNAKYSEEDFLKLFRTEQLTLAENYWNGAVADFDDGTFQFSYPHFVKICERIGFRKGIVDTALDGDNKAVEPGSIIYIEHGRREDTVEKKIILSKATVKKMEKLIERPDGEKQLSNVEKSKVIDAILSQAIDQMLHDKSVGQFGVDYRPLAEERLI